MDTLALGYVIPAIRAHSGLTPVRQCSCRAYYIKKSHPFRKGRLFIRYSNGYCIIATGGVATSLI
ncbi:hypothetical protein B5F25_10290 [Bacteroides sp. An19]|nr:hypothetical protein B5F25_10290 [Bacteroides sp. An19]